MVSRACSRSSWSRAMPSCRLISSWSCCRSAACSREETVQGASSAFQLPSGSAGRFSGISWHRARAARRPNTSFQQGIAGQPVGPLEPRTGSLSAGVQAFHRGTAPAIGTDASHHVMAAGAWGSAPSPYPLRSPGGSGKSWGTSLSPFRFPWHPATHGHCRTFSFPWQWPGPPHPGSQFLHGMIPGHERSPGCCTGGARTLTASETRKLGRPGMARAVGWNWTNSISISSAPARQARARPLPVAPSGLVVWAKSRPTPPVASTTPLAARRTVRPLWSAWRPGSGPPGPGDPLHSSVPGWRSVFLPRQWPGEPGTLPPRYCPHWRGRSGSGCGSLPRPRARVPSGFLSNRAP